MSPSLWLIVHGVLIGVVVCAAATIDLPSRADQGSHAVILTLGAGGVGAWLGGMRAALYEQTPIVGGLLALFTYHALLAAFPAQHVTVWFLGVALLVGLLQEEILSGAPVVVPGGKWRAAPVALVLCLLARSVHFFATVAL